MDSRERRERFRAVLSGDECVFPASVFDPLSARIAEDLGFEVGMLAGSVASLVVLGAPDLVVLTLDELAQQVRRICRAADLSLLVDADHGYGNALNAMRTVEELETAGVAALSIEDTRLPPGGSSPELISLEEGVGKIRAALSARQDPSLVILGRTGAARIAGIGEALARAKAYEREGVDGIFLVGLESVGELEAARAELRVPLVLGGGPPQLTDAARLAEHGVRIALQGHAPFRAALKATYDTLRALRQGTPPGELRESVAPRELVERLSRAADYAHWQSEFVTGKG